KPKYRLFPQNFHVVQLNVGGHLYTTTLSTLRKHPDSKLAEIFSGPPKLRADTQGRYFIDRDGSHFGAILEFLRSEQLPKENIQEVHKEAVHYNIKPLIKLLEETPRLFGELVGRQQFLSRVPHYKENIEVLIRIARAEAIAARYSYITICVLRTEEDLGFYDNAINSLDAAKESVVTFGPWKALGKQAHRARAYVGEVVVPPHGKPFSRLLGLPKDPAISGGSGH
ncbi:BTB/POZ domain-containing protein KCTD14-like, partial [Neolamprologus brichardi]|uniref:BTB/POZ domain-containing protein KCTD14-like n=1 Tax=Neolamprologus brichardi TaxID=32507 RepID=UPI001643F7C4